MKVRLKISELRPNNWFLCEEKVLKIRNVWLLGKQSELPPVVVTRIDNQLSLIDGNTRAYVALENGSEEIEAELLNLNLIDGPLDLYTYIHRKGPANGVELVSDLQDRILSSDEFKKRWIDFCTNWKSAR